MFSSRLTFSQRVKEFSFLITQIPLRSSGQPATEQSPEAHRSSPNKCKEFQSFKTIIGPTPEAARSKEWVCGRSLSEIVGLNPAGGMDICLL